MTATHETPTKDIHTAFGLSYASYMVLPRTLLQSMPEEWQHKFVALVDELHAAFRHIEQAEAYDIIPGKEAEIGDLSPELMKQLGVTVGGTEKDDEDEWATSYFYKGEEYESWERIIVPSADPVPHYNRGRTHVEPRIGDRTS